MEATGAAVAIFGKGAFVAIVIKEIIRAVAFVRISRVQTF
jgi:hypothetical protein